MGLIKKNSNPGTVSTDWNDIKNKPLLDIAGIYSSFSYSNSFPKLLGNVTKNLNISKIVLDIKTAFDDVNTTITIGDLENPSKFMSATDNDANSVIKWSVDPDYKYDTDTDIYMFVNGVNTQGEGIVNVYFD